MNSPPMVRRSERALAPRRGRAWGTGGAAAVQLVMERVFITAPESRHDL
jgi:hypothetical protein